MTSNDKIVDSNVGNSSDFSPRLHGECKWTIFNTGMAIFLGLTLILNLITAFIIFRVPLITNRGRSNPVYLCIRFLNVVDMTQVGSSQISRCFCGSLCGYLWHKLSSGSPVLFHGRLHEAKWDVVNT